jgi:hypothetical protein
MSLMGLITCDHFPTLLSSSLPLTKIDDSANRYSDLMPPTLFDF